jgi:predicted ribosome quality control (RQC) complex YloA/Tae2 family protein
VSNSCFIGNIREVTTAHANAIPVLIDSFGQLGTASSSRRFKKEIRPMDKSSESLLALKPVTFHYKNDSKGVPQFGLIAEEVAAVNPDLVVRDKSGEIYTVRYEAVNAMLLNEFLKEHGKVEKLESDVAQLTARLKEQDSKIEKMSDRLELSKPALQTAANNQ